MNATGVLTSENAPVFISFASKELQVAERVVKQLEQSGIRCWIANRDIPPGASYPASITAAITGASAVLLLLTEASNKSPHILSEVELAFNARKPILPVRLTPVALSPNLQYFLGTTQWLDAGTDFDDGDATRVQARLTRIIAGEPIVVGPGLDATTSRRPIAYAAVAVLVLLAVVVAFLLRAQREAPGQAQPPATESRPNTTVETPAPAAVTPAITLPPAPEVRPEEKKEVPSPALRTRVNAQDGQVYVWIPGGRFTLGCSPGDSECEADEFPSHLVRIATGFWMSRTEVTRAQYAKGLRRAGTVASGDLPVTAVAWADAKKYCVTVGGRLPTESEWEYAARAGSAGARYDSLRETGWYAADSDEQPHPVGLKAPNAFGLFDVLGNVYEWVADRHYNAYDVDDDTLVEPIAPNASGTVRGGAFTSEAKEVRVSNRFGLPPDAEEPIVGFRCVADR